MSKDKQVLNNEVDFLDDVELERSLYGGKLLSELTDEEKKQYGVIEDNKNQD